MVHRSPARVGEQMVTIAQWGYMKTASDGGTFVSDAQRWLHLVTAKEEARWGSNWFLLQETPALAPQTFNILPACLYLFPLVSLDGCCGSLALQFPQSREVKRRMQTGWFPRGAGKPLSLCNCFWRFTCHILSCFWGVVKCLDFWMCSQYAVFPVDKRSNMSKLWKRQKREIEKQNILKKERERHGEGEESQVEIGTIA